MKVIFANGSLAKLKYLALSENTGSGFLKTERLGRYIFITDLISGNLGENSVKSDLNNIYDLWGLKFGGVFINGEDEILPECFFEKFVLKLNGDKYTISFYDSETGKKELIRKGFIYGDLDE